MDREQIRARMDEIMALDELTDELVEEYEGLERQDEALRKRDEIRARHEARGQLATPPAAVMGRDDVDAEMEGFRDWMRTGRRNDDLIRADQTKGTDSEGGFTVPETMRQRIIERLLAFGGVAPEVETITTASGERLHWPTLDDTANEGSIAAEATAATGGADLVFGEGELGAFRYVAPGADNTGADPLRVSVELLQDSAFDIEALVVRKLGERIARKQADDWINGAGTTEPFGLVTSSGASASFAGATPTVDELIDALHSVDPAYRSNGVWTFNDATLAEIRKIVDSDGRPLWAASAESGLITTPGGTLLGHRVVIDQEWADFTDASGNDWGAFGDLREGYIIRRVQSIQLIRDEITRASTGQVNFWMWARADGMVQNPNSFTILRNTAT